MSKKSKNKADYSLPPVDYKIKGVETPLIDEFADALIKQQFMCADVENESYENQLNCAIAKQKLFKAYKNFVYNGSNEISSINNQQLYRVNEHAFGFKKLMDVNMQKNL